MGAFDHECKTGQFSCCLCGRVKEVKNAIRPTKPFRHKGGQKVYPAGSMACAICRNDDCIEEVT